MMDYIRLLALLCLTLPAHSEMASMLDDDMDGFLSNIPELQSKPYVHQVSLRANFDLGSQHGRLSSCQNNKPRKEKSFYPCWNHQAQPFFDQLGFLLGKEDSGAVPTEFRFVLSKSGRLKDIQIYGVSDTPTKNKLVQLLKQMEFGYTYRGQDEPVILSVDTKMVSAGQ